MTHPTDDIRPLDEAFDTMMEVERNPNGAWNAIQTLAAQLAAANARADRAEAALAALQSAPRVNETPKSERDRADVLTAVPAPVTLAEALKVPEVRALVEAGNRMANSIKGDYIHPGAATAWDAALAAFDKTD